MILNTPVKLPSTNFIEPSVELSILASTSDLDENALNPSLHSTDHNSLNVNNDIIILKQHKTNRNYVKVILINIKFV